MYYEIQAILKQVPNLKPVLDRTAAVKYLTFDNNQWISYDDADTFKLKLAWANQVGFGGSMIWAVDTDDDKFSAMSGLMGYQVSHVETTKAVALAQTSENVASSLQGENGQACAVAKDEACKKTRDLHCFSGETMVGWDRDGCVSETPTHPTPWLARDDPSHAANHRPCSGHRFCRRKTKASPSAAPPGRPPRSASGEDLVTTAVYGATATASAGQASRELPLPNGKLPSRTRDVFPIQEQITDL